MKHHFSPYKVGGPYKPQIAPQGGRHLEKPYNRYSGQKVSGHRREKPIRDNHNNTRFKPHGRGRGGFQRSPNIRNPRIVSKTPDKDKMTYHYCQEIGHFIRDCRKRLRDEEKSAKCNLLTLPEEQEQNFSNDKLEENVESLQELNI